MAIAINGSGTVTGISVGGLPDGIVDSGTLATNSVDSAELIDGSIDASHLASGVGGAWNLIGTNVASNSASLTQTGLDSTYDTYAIVLADMLSAGDGSVLAVRFGDSGGVDSGGTDYAWRRDNNSEANNTYSGDNSTGDDMILLTAGVGLASGEGAGAMLYIHRPGDGTTQPILSGTWAGIDTSGNLRGGGCFGMRQTNIVLDRVQCLFDGQNITSGRMSVYGIAHA